MFKRYNSGNRFHRPLQHNRNWQPKYSNNSKLPENYVLKFYPVNYNAYFGINSIEQKLILINLTVHRLNCMELITPNSISKQTIYGIQTNFNQIIQFLPFHGIDSLNIWLIFAQILPWQYGLCIKILLFILFAKYSCKCTCSHIRQHMDQCLLQSS